MKTEAQKRATKKYFDKNYKEYKVRLRKEDDKHLIKFVEENKDDCGTTNLFRAGLELLKKELKQ